MLVLLLLPILLLPALLLCCGSGLASACTALPLPRAHLALLPLKPLGALLEQEQHALLRSAVHHCTAWHGCSMLSMPGWVGYCVGAACAL